MLTRVSQYPARCAGLAVGIQTAELGSSHSHRGIGKREQLITNIVYRDGPAIQMTIEAAVVC
jgi:hypothetical protein